MGIFRKVYSHFYLLVLLAFVACSKDDAAEKCRVIYQVTEQNATPRTFRVSYVGSNSETVIREHTGIIWTSGEVERERQDFVSITVESSESSGSFDITIFKNSVPYLQAEMHNPSSGVTLSGNLPQ